ncbi:MAG: hypothetical protein IJF11_01335 [Clostridia bacterium]|nr:hypothetical protein [Clostridia bacterium]
MEIKRKSTLKLLAFILSVLMLIVSMPLTAFALALDSLNDSTDTPSTSPKDIIVLEEDKALREENVKHFKLSNGTTKAVIYPGAVHYKDANGNWIDIDNALTLNGSEYSTSNKSKIKFATKSGSNCLISIKDGEYKIDFTPLNTNKVNVAIENPQKSNSRKFEDLSRLNSLVSMATYANIYDGIDLEYILAGNNVKENIIVKEKQDSYTFAFELKLNKLSAMLENGAVILTDADTGEQKYKIPTPYMYDANGVYSNGVEYSLVQESKWKYTLTVIASADWINEDERAFPVTIDPTIGYESTQINDYTIKNGQITDNEMLKIGGGSSSYIELSSLPSFPKDAYLTDAYLSLNYLAGSGTIGLFDTNEANPPMDYVNVSDDDTQWYTLNLRNLVDAWYKGTYEEYIICLGMISGAEVSVASSDTVDASRPIIAITYRDMKGAEPYWSFISQSAGNAGTGSINLATGNLLFEISTPSTTDSLFSFTPSLIYNSAIAGEEYKYSNAQIGYWGTYVANGFKANFNEALIKDSYINSNGDSETYYIWADSDGTEHYFIKDSEGVYRDEDGLQLTLSTNDNDITQNCIITDSAHNQRIFAHMSGTVSSEIEATWYLSKLRDPSGNELYFQIDGSKKPNDIKIIPNGQNAITMISPLYNANSRLALLWNNSSKEGVVFRHSTNPDDDEELSTNGGKYLREAIYIKCESNIGWSYVMNNFLGDFDNQTDGITVNAIMQYSYDPNGYLTEAHDTLSGYKIKYTYEDGQVTGVTEYGKNGTQGQTIGINYETGYTEVHTSGSNDIYGDNDDIINVYVFDNQGRTITTYSTNEDRTEIYGASSGEYDGEATNSLKTSSVSSGTSSNYIVNGNFEVTDSLWQWTVSDSNKVTFQYEDGNAPAWDNGRAVISADKNTEQYIKQTVVLTDGDYTMSLDLKGLSDTELITVKLIAQTRDGVSYEKEIVIDSSTSVDKTDFATMSFSLDGELNSAIICDVFVKVVAEDEAVSVEIDNLMLSKTTGAQKYNYVNDAEFELSYFGENTNNVGIWCTAPIETNTDWYTTFRKSLKLSGEIDEEKYVTQLIYKATEQEMQLSSNGFCATQYPTMFNLSGFGKATSILSSKDSFFGLKLEIKVLVPEYNENNEIIGFTEKPLEYETKFKQNTQNWQYSSVSAVIPENVFISEIRVYCEYSNNLGEALFDKISLTQENAGDIVQYDYYSGGRIKSQKSSSSVVNYVYYDDGNVEYAIFNDKMIRYEYSSNKVSKQTTYLYDRYIYDVENPTIAMNYKELMTIDNIVVYEYDSYGLPIKTRVSGGDTYSETIYEYYYDNRIFGAIKSVTDSLGNVTRYFYDNKNGNLIATTEPDGYGIYYRYDDLGNVVSIQKAMYNGGNAALSVSGNGLVTFEYDDANMLQSINANGTIYDFTYDIFGNGEEIFIGDDKIIEQTYNSNNGKLLSVRYGNNVLIEYTYDNLDRVTEITYSKGSKSRTYTYTYDSSGNVIKVENDDNNQTTMYDYDSSGNLKRYYTYNSNTGIIINSMSYSYDSKARLSEASYYKDFLINSDVYEYYTANHNYQYEYGNDDSLSSSSISFMNNNMYSFNYSYDAFGRLTQRTSHFNEEMTIINAYVYVNDNSKTSNRVDKYISQISGFISFEYDYEYDTNGNITKVYISEDNLIYSYEYDSHNRLTRENDAIQEKTYIYLYDPSGNIFRIKEYSYTTEGIASATLKRTISYTYSTGAWKDQLVSYKIENADGTEVEKTIAYDEIGNPTEYLGYDMEWNELGELEVIRNGEEILAYYDYSDSGIRSRKTVDGVIHNYIYEGTTLLYEYYGEVFIAYFYDESGAPIGMAYRDGSKANLNLPMEEQFEYYYFTKNLQGDIMIVMSDNGIAVAAYSYDAWGNHIVDAQSGYEYIANANPFRYRGYYYDAETGFYYLQTRYYDPQLRRFISADDIGFLGADGGLQSYNLYAYCQNNPIMYADPSGEFAISLIVGLAVSFVIGTIASATSQYVQYGEVNVLQAGIDGLFAVASTALAYTGIGLVGSIAVGAGMGLAQYAIDSAIFHDDFTWSGALIATGLGALGGLASGRGAQHFKSIGSNLDETGRTGVKAILTAFDRYGKGSGYQKVMNLWGGRVANSLANSISQNFTKSALIIWGTTATTYVASYWLGKINWGF